MEGVVGTDKGIKWKSGGPNRITILFWEWMGVFHASKNN